MMQFDPSQKLTNESVSYPPSFIDKFMQTIQRLPMPYWLTYGLLIVLESLISHILAWVDGWLTVFTFNSLLLLFPLWQWGTFLAITYLNKTAEATISSFRPLLDVDDDKIEKLKSEFTNMPTRGVVLSGVMWILFYLLLTYISYDTFYVGYGLGRASQVFTFLIGLIGYSTGSVIYFHSIRQLWLVNRTVKMVKRFNLFHLQPVYSFSRLTSRTGISWIFLLGLTLLTFPLSIAGWMSLILLGFQIVLALAAFVLPLRFVNRYLVAEKRKLLGDNRRRMEAILGRLHQRLAEGDISEMEMLNFAIVSLTTERDILAKISTFPWNTSTLTSFLSATVLPVVLILVQIAIQKWLGG